MPVWGRRGSYVAVTYTLVALVGVTVFAQCTRDLIPPPESNDLEAYRAKFLARAAKQVVRWRTTDDAPFAEARRLDKPVMVFAGTAASQAARRYDDRIFGNREVAARLNQDFVCVRIDLVQEPEWRSAFLSVLRSSVDADPSYAVYFFNPDGTLLTWTGRRTWEDRPDFNDFLGLLSLVSDQWRSQKPGEWSQAQREQSAERRALREGGTTAVPDFEAFAQSYAWRSRFVFWQPAKYRFLLQAGRYGDVASLLGAELCSPRTDLVDGGFFRLASGEDLRIVEFDKVAVTNADMLAVLARAYVATREPIFEYWYGRTLVALDEQFTSGETWASFIEVDVGEDGRSKRHSFGAAVSRTEFDSFLRGFSAQLSLSDNPLAVPHLREPSLVVSERESLDRAVGALQKIGEHEGEGASGDDSLDSAAFVVARLYEAADLMNDPAALALAEERVAHLEKFRAGTNEVRHSTFGRGLGRKWLGDYTGYADAMLEAFLATGQERRLESGEVVLRRALELFAKPATGDYVSVTGGGRAEVDLEMPPLVDDGWTPALPWLATLCFRYGAVLGDQALRQRAVEIVERFAAIANGQPHLFATYYSMAFEIVASGVLVVPGESTSAADIRTLRASERNTEVTAGGRRYVGSSGTPFRR